VPLVRLTGASPVARGCPAAGPTVQRGAEVEPQLAVDPANPNRLVATWQQDRDRMGGALSTGLALTDDGGRTWRPVAVPGVTACPSGRGERASDPWISIGPDGIAYLSTIMSSGATPLTTRVLVSRSADGGATWAPPVVVAGLGGFEDKESVTADPIRPRTAYAVWGHVVREVPRVTLLSRTVDGGVTWSAPRPIYRPAPGRAANGNQIVVTPDGALVDVFFQTRGRPRGVVLKAIRSDDQGATWSRSALIGRASGFAVGDAERRAPVRSGASLPSAAVAPGGEILVAWQTATSARRGRILLARSSDGGRSFARPVRVARAGARPFTPVVAAGPAGIAVSFYDLRRERRGDRALTTTFRLAQSRDGGATWQETLLGRPFDLRRAPRSGGELFLGDYTGLVALPDGFGAAFTASRPLARGGRSDVFFARAP
jgi:photosystem II stability/assembly factor-like uncharacterized protein